MLVYGSTITYKRLGYAADFCPLCAAPRQFAIERVGKSHHLYWISFGEGKLLEYRRVCLHCHTQYAADPLEYRTLAKAPAPLAQLTRETFHNLAHARAAQMQRARQARDDPASLTAPMRHQMLLEPFLIVSAQLTLRRLLAGGELESTYIKREIYPLLAGALARLTPSQEEIDTVMQHLRQARDGLAKHLKTPLLMAAINEQLSGPAPVRPPLSRRRGGGVQAGYMDAVRTLRLLALLCMVVLAGMALVLVGDLVRGEPLPLAMAAIMTALGAAAAFMHHVAAPKIARHAPAGRVAGFAVAALCCALIPIGPFIGLYLLWCLTVGWGDYFDHALLRA